MHRARRTPLWASLGCVLALVAAVAWVLTQGYLTAGTIAAVALLGGTILSLPLGAPGPAETGEAERLARGRR